MKLVGREVVIGAHAQFVLGHQVSRDRVSRNWSVQYTWRGRQQSKSLGTPTKRLAMKRVWELDRQLGEDNPGKPNGEAAVSELVEVYMQMQRARGRAVTTVRKYEEIGQTLVAWADQERISRAMDLHEPEFWRFAQMLKNKGNSERTRYTKLDFLKQVWKHGLRIKRIPSNELATIHMDKPVPEKQPCFTPEQVVALLNEADPFHGQVFSFLAYAGLRFGELRDLTWSQLRLDRGAYGVIELRRGGSGEGTKSKRLRRIHIHPKLRDVIDLLPEGSDNDRVFTAPSSTQYPEGGGPLKERRLLNTLKRLCRECRFRNPDKYCLHTFRHSFASMCARNNVSYKYALAWMGHTSSGILDLYFEMYDPTADAAMATLDYEKASGKGGGVKESPASREAKKNRKTGRRKSRSKPRAGESSKRWKVTSRKRSAGDSG